MVYKSDISRENPTCILFIVDQSTSMQNRLEGGSSKALYLADAINRAIYTMIVRCTRSDGIRDYFQLGIIGYSGSEARNAWLGALALQELHDISEVAAKPFEIQERHQQFASDSDSMESRPVKFPIWMKPVSAGYTSMCAGLRRAHSILVNWCETHPQNYPPTVIHITDGHPTDGDPEPIATSLKELGTNDGKLILFNVHVDVGSGVPILFPISSRELPDRFGVKLFRMSSVLPSQAIQLLRQKGIKVGDSPQAFVYNADIQAIVDLFDIGTRPSNFAER